MRPLSRLIRLIFVEGLAQCWRVCVGKSMDADDGGHSFGIWMGVFPILHFVRPSAHSTDGYALWNPNGMAHLRSSIRPSVHRRTPLTIAVRGLHASHGVLVCGSRLPWQPLVEACPEAHIALAPEIAFSRFLVFRFKPPTRRASPPCPSAAGLCWPRP